MAFACMQPLHAAVPVLGATVRLWTPLHRCASMQAARVQGCSLQGERLAAAARTDLCRNGDKADGRRERRVGRAAGACWPCCTVV